MIERCENMLADRIYNSKEISENDAAAILVCLSTQYAINEAQQLEIERMEKIVAKLADFMYEVSEKFAIVQPTISIIKKHGQRIEDCLEKWGKGEG